METPLGEKALFIAVNRSEKNAVVPNVDYHRAQFIFGAPYTHQKPGLTDLKLPPFGFSILRIDRIHTAYAPELDD